MVDSLEEILRRQKEFHEKARQDAIRKLKGKQLEDTLKKLDELNKPIEEIDRKYKRVKFNSNVSAKQIILIVLSFLFIIIGAVIAEAYFESVLFFNEKMNWVVFYILCPIGAASFLFIILLIPPRFPRRGHTIDLKTGKWVTTPRYLLVLFSIIVGMLFPAFVIYVPLCIGMNFMNSHPIKLESTLIEIKNHKGRDSTSSYFFDCKVLAYKKENAPPSEETIVMPLDQLKMPLKDGDKIILVGRESFAGIVIDGIEKAH